MVPTENLIPVGLLTGPTATGKSGLAIEFALNQGGIEIINADSMLVYRGMDIGTAKPSLHERKQIPHHLIDVKNPNETFTAGEFKRAVLSTIDEIHSRGNRALIVGGTGFYLKSLLFGLWKAPPSHPEIRKKLEEHSNDELYKKLLEVDPISAQRIGHSDRYRLIRGLEIIELSGKSLEQLQSELPPEPDPRFHLWILDRSNPDLQTRIHLRTSQMIQEGLIEEYQKIHSLYPESRSLMAIGYAQVKDFLEGKPPAGRKIKPGIEGLQEEIELATRQLVKRQRTWFRNQSQKTPQSEWFHFEEDRSRLELAIKKVYG